MMGWVLTIVMLLVVVEWVDGNETSLGGRGFGDEFSWKSWKDGIAEAEAQKKPAMLLFHSASCGACHALGRVFTKSRKLLERSEDFVMINVLTDVSLGSIGYTWRR